MLSRSRKYNSSGFAEGITQARSSEHVGLVIVDREDNSLNVSIRLDEMPEGSDTWGDKKLFNYIMSVGKGLSPSEIEALSNSDEQWSLVRVTEREKRRRS